MKDARLFSRRERSDVDGRRRALLAALLGNSLLTASDWLEEIDHCCASNFSKGSTANAPVSWWN
jgi:hypothetical protein